MSPSWMMSSLWAQPMPPAESDEEPNAFLRMDPKPLFHERQVGRQCGLHCVNNLLQRRCYELADLNQFSADIKNQRAFIQRGGRRPSLPGGDTIRKIHAAIADYDVQVLELALEKQGVSLRWWDRRLDVEKLKLEDDSLGFIMNRRRWVNIGEWSDRHWFCIRRFRDGFFNLDSKLKEPEHLGGIEDLRTWIRKCLDLDEKCCLFRVLRKTPKTERWARLRGLRNYITSKRKDLRASFGPFNVTPVRKDNLKVRRPVWSSFQQASLRTKARWSTTRSERSEAVVLMQMARCSSLC
eukprot:gnl/MRDRNA2_/MRDRNA2_98979_c0_seq1.p1 gnl/MRDRNA2_/MRDRNA2_98979_c0~~gnl/MRDRNA2_/MRDRNA2_98979_c0_seq1.p1  ORF type:complete len:307 (+),score=29.71 gnl/MRDRNA2_/MRDRNA2_98979_c0_seq1:37-921(+)